MISTFKETGSGVKVDRAERRKVMALAQVRRIDAVLVTELSRWAQQALEPAERGMVAEMRSHLANL